VTLEGFFAGHEVSARLFDAVRAAIADVGPADVRVTTSQVAFRRRTGLAFAWMPNMYLRKGGVPLVLTIGLQRRDDSPRWKQVVEPAPGRFTHHLELRTETDIDDEVRSWLREAWEQAR
jgi:hypothetical protein